MGKFEGKVGFAIGTGRCGTHFLDNVLKLEPGIASTHERNPLNECFHRYCKWYNLPVDNEGFLYTKEQEINQDLAHHNFSFEASAFLCFSVAELYQRFDAKFILLVRSPERVVNSFIEKGWYDKPIIYNNQNLALGYQDTEKFHHFLGRVVPKGKDFQLWHQMSQVGKLAWFWNQTNLKIIESFKTIPESHWRIQKLEELSYDSYLEIAEFLGFQSNITKQNYEQITNKRPGKRSNNLRTISSWTNREIKEFETEVKTIAEELGYEYGVDNLPIPTQKKADSLSIAYEKIYSYLKVGLNRARKLPKNG